MKRALVISGGGSKGAFAGGVAQYLIAESKLNYDLFLGTSTGSLLVSHLALGKIETIKKAYTHVTQELIFDNCPFLIKQQGKVKRIKIHHLNVLKNFLRGRKIFGESNNLRKHLATYFLPSDFKPYRLLLKKFWFVCPISQPIQLNINHCMILNMKLFWIGFGFRVIMYPL